MYANRRELLLQRESPGDGLLVFIRVHSWLTAMQNKTANAPAFAQTCGAAGANRHELLLQNEV